MRTAASVAGEYVLTHRNGQPLPHTQALSLAGHACTSVLVRDVLTVHADGTWDDEYESRDWCDPMPAPDTMSVVHTAGRFHLHGASGDSIVLVDTAEALGRRQNGTVSDDEIRVEFDSRWRSVFRYLRQKN